MGIGAVTRERILDEAVRLASRDGLVALTIGTLADALALSKSGLFAHFGSKEALQLAVIERVGLMYRERALAPAAALPAGPERLRALLRGMLDWMDASDLPGGCPISAASFELDGQAAGPLREAVAAAIQAGLQRNAQAFRECLPGVGDAEQAAFELRAITLGYHVASRLLRDPQARRRAEAAFEALLARGAVGRKGGSPAKSAPKRKSARRA
ncbi:MAG: TetR/AcrR family transcriptional regulator [Anaeromyxobacter sp.]